MSSETLFLSDALSAYMKVVSLREPDILSRLRKETSHDPMHMMQISPEQGQFMSLVVKLMEAKRAIEIGVYRATAPFGWPWRCRQMENWWPVT